MNLLSDSDAHIQKHRQLKLQLLEIEADFADSDSPGPSDVEVQALEAQGLASSTLLPRSTAHAMPLYKWQVTFNGLDSQNTLLPFLEQVDELCLARDVTYESLFISAIDLFTEPARSWYVANKQLVSDWHELVALLKNVSFQQTTIAKSNFNLTVFYRAMTRTSLYLWLESTDSTLVYLLPLAKLIRLLMFASVWCLSIWNIPHLQISLL